MLRYEADKEEVKSQSAKVKNGLSAGRTKSGKRPVKVKMGCRPGKV
jgi:hypothetical protein